MGSVWRVRDDRGPTFSRKILRDSLTDEAVAGSGSASTALHDPDLKPDVTPRERLRREAMALKKINHPGVCGIEDMRAPISQRTHSKIVPAAPVSLVELVGKVMPLASSEPGVPIHVLGNRLCLGKA